MNTIKAIKTAPEKPGNSTRPKKRPEPPRKPFNRDRRSREHLTVDEIQALATAARGQGRHGVRDRAIILLAFNHGLRSAEVARLRWDSIDIDRGTIHVNRLKRGNSSVQHLTGVEKRALRALGTTDSPFVFTTETGGQVSTRRLRLIVARAGKAAGIRFPVSFHMLRHSAGYYLVNNGVSLRIIQQLLGHTSLQHTARYTELDENALAGVMDGALADEAGTT